MQLLVFELAAVRYAVGLERVREVARAAFVTPLPEAPDVVEGVVDVRGRLTPVFDLRLRFGLPLKPLHPDDVLVVVDAGEGLAALRCDRADRVLTVAADAVASSPPLLHASAAVAGVARLPDGLALIHDPAAFLTEAERITLDAALAQAARAG